jgi:hypothetical protein
LNLLRPAARRRLFFLVDKQGVCAPRLVAPDRAFSDDANGAFPAGEQRVTVTVMRGAPPGRSIK